MKTHSNSNFGVELRLNYFREFAICGVPVPQYTNGTSFILSFDNAENYISYTNILMIIVRDLELADPDHHKYEIQRSIIFIKYLLTVMHDRFLKLTTNS